MAKLPKKLTWEMAKADDSIGSFEHPLFPSPFDKETFEQTFGPVLAYLDGASEADYVSFFFERSPSDPSHLVYTDKDSQQDFLEWVQEEGCMPTTKEVQEGEDKTDKDARKAEEDRAAQIQREKKAAKRKAMEARSPEQKDADMIANRVRGLNATRSKLAKETREKQLAKLKAKVATAEEQIKAAVAAFREAHPDKLDLLPEEFQESGDVAAAAVGGAATGGAAAGGSGAGEASTGTGTEVGATAAGAASPAEEASS